jgi:putative ABC transport system ATP-binding protein
MTLHFEAREVTRVFRSASGPIRALDGVSLEVARGSFVAITGPSGRGKTTLLALLGALDRPTTGQVLFDNDDLGGASEPYRSRVRRRLGIVFQSSPMIPLLPLWENVTYPLVPKGVPTPPRSSSGSGSGAATARGRRSSPAASASGSASRARSRSTRRRSSRTSRPPTSTPTRPRPSSAS